MNYALIFAILVPLFWGFDYIFDKYLVENKAKSPLSLAALEGIATLVIGLIVSLFVDWQGFQLNDLWFPALVGFLLGLQFYLYFTIFKKEDVSEAMGLIYVYPVIVVLFSYFFFGERIALLGYFGIVLILAGVLILSIRLEKIKLHVGVWMLVGMIFLIAGHEIFVKYSTSHLGVFQGIGISNIVLGLTTLPLLLSKKIRASFKADLKIAGWAFASQILTFFAILCTFFAMSGLPATFVTSVGAAEPLAALAFEQIAVRYSKNMERDRKVMPKVEAIVLIVVGVVLLYLS